MYKRILVPLDGSPRAEQALQIASRLASASGGSILLLRVVSTLSEFGVYSPGTAVYLQELIEKDLVEATAYLARLAHESRRGGVETRISVFSGQVADQILEVARSQEIDLIVLCSHGYTGFKRWALGSVAQKVARHSPIPVLLLREQNMKLKEQIGHSIRATVALDGSLFAEAALLPAARIIMALSAPEEGELHLMQLVDLPTIEEEFRSLLSADFDFRQTALREAGDYVQATRAALLQKFPEKPGFRLTWSVEECTNIAEGLMQITEKGKGIGTHKASDLLALTTHGRGGLQRWLLGSVTERVLHCSTLPLLIVHPQGVIAPSHAEDSEGNLIPESESHKHPEKEKKHVSTNSSTS